MALAGISHTTTIPIRRLQRLEVAQTRSSVRQHRLILCSLELARLHFMYLLPTPLLGELKLLRLHRYLCHPSISLLNLSRYERIRPEYFTTIVLVLVILIALHISGLFTSLASCIPSFINSGTPRSIVGCPVDVSHMIYGLQLRIGHKSLRCSCIIAFLDFRYMFQTAKPSLHHYTFLLGPRQRNTTRA